MDIFVRFVLVFIFSTISGRFVFAEEIRVGMSTALSGPLQEVGQAMRTGVEAYFTKVNQLGGVNGLKLKLIVKDDGYEPIRAARNMRDLIDNEKVLAVIGNVGTPTAMVTVPIANEKRTLLFGAFTGADILRKKPRDRYTLNYRASYAEEAATMIDGLLEAGFKPEEIAFFTQRDGYGDAGYNGAVAALKRNHFKNTDSLIHGRYTRNTLNVEAAVARLIDAKVRPKAIIMVGSYEPSAKFISLAKKEIPGLIFLNLSFVGAHSLVNVLGKDTEGVIVIQAVPHYDSNLGIADEYRQDMSRYMPEIQMGFVSFEGYIVARLFVEALQTMKGEITKEGLIDAFHNFVDLDIGLGTKISFANDDSQAIHDIWPMIFRKGAFEAIDWYRLGR